MLRKTMMAGLALLMLSCGNAKKEEKSDQSSGGGIVEGVSNLNKMAKSADKMKDLSETLKKLTPLTNDELKAVIPETLNGLKRKSFSAGGYGMAGMSAIQAEYGDDNKNVKISILDGAGETGSAVVSLMAMTLSMDAESESNGTKSKTTEINGLRAITEDTKSGESISSSIKYLYKDRYSIGLDGQGYSLSELETYMKALPTSALK